MKRSDLSDEQNRLMDTARAYYYADRGESVSPVSHNAVLAARDAFSAQLSLTPLAEVADLFTRVPCEDA